MAQITTGIRSILSIPAIYEWSQKIMGAGRVRTMLINDYIKPQEGMTILDIGCGPADILAYLPNVEYYGFDISESYIESAQLRYGERGKFFAKYLISEDLKDLPKFDLVLMFGVLHHLDDDTASNIMEIVNDALKPGGRLITIDPVFEKGQSPIAKFLISKDRGQNVRTGIEYLALVQDKFRTVNKRIRNQSFIPYTHCILECCNT